MSQLITRSLKQPRRAQSGTGMAPLNPLMTVVQPLLVLLGRLNQGYRPKDTALLWQHIAQQQQRMEQALAQHYDRQIAQHAGYILKRAFEILLTERSTHHQPIPCFEDITTELLAQSPPHMDLVELLYVCAKHTHHGMLKQLDHEQRAQREAAIHRIYQCIRHHRGAHQQALLTHITPAKSQRPARHSSMMSYMGWMLVCMGITTLITIYYAADQQASILNDYFEANQ